MLHPYNETFPSSTLAAMGATKRLTEHYGRKIEIYSDFLDLVRFPGAEYRRLVSSHLSQKYTQNRPDLIFALDAESLRFSLRQPYTFGPDVPIVFCCASPHTLQDLEVPSNVVGIVSEYDLRQTVELATRLQPDARHLFVVAGAGETDQRWVARARHQLIAYESHLEMTYLIGLERSALLDKVAAVPRSSIILTLPIFRDSGGRPYIPREIIREDCNRRQCTSLRPIRYPDRAGHRWRIYGFVRSDRGSFRGPRHPSACRKRPPYVANCEQHSSSSYRGR